jgi:hypothetical protein
MNAIFCFYLYKRVNHWHVYILPPELIASIFNILATGHDWDEIYCAGSKVYPSFFKQIPIASKLWKSWRLIQYTTPNGLHDNHACHILSLSLNMCIVQSCTFRCEVGYLAWSSFSSELQTSLRKLFLSPQLKALSLRNLGSVPVFILRNPVVRFFSLNLNHVSILSPDLLDESQLDDLPATQPRLSEHPHRLDREHRISIAANGISRSKPENHQVALLGRYVSLYHEKLL